MRLYVMPIDLEDVYKDIVRIPDKYRGNIPEGKICKLSVNGRTKLVQVRGLANAPGAIICLDELTRNQLNLDLDSEYDFQINSEGFFKEVRWMWYAADPAYRIAARLGIWSVIVSILGVVFGVVAYFLSKQ